MKKVFLLTLACILLLSAIGCSVVRNRGEVKLSGTFIQAWLCSSWDDARWEQELKMLKDVGMDILIWSDVVGYYPSELEGLKDNYVGHDVVDTVLRNCKKYGFKVFVGMGGDNRWWNCFPYERDYLYATANTFNNISTELYEKYYEKYQGTFYGWYWCPEIWNHPSFLPVSDMRDEYLDTLADAFNICLNHLDVLSLGMPMMLSPFVQSRLGSADSNYAFWRDLINKTDFRKQDILCPQDSVGAGGLKLEDLEEWIVSYRKAVDETGKLNLWSNCEDFDISYGSAGSADIRRFSEQMKIVAKYCDKTITFAYPHYYSPYNTNPAYHEVYKTFLETGMIESEKPTAPKDFNAELTYNPYYEEYIDLTLTWSPSVDNVGVAGYNIYRNGELIEIIRSPQTTLYVEVLFLDILDSGEPVTYSIRAVDCSGNLSDETVLSDEIIEKIIAQISAEWK